MSRVRRLSWLFSLLWEVGLITCLARTPKQEGKQGYNYK